MDTEKLLSRSKLLQDHLTEIRRDLHRHPETGFELDYTLNRIKKELDDIG